MKKKMNKVFVVCLAATAMTAGMSVMSFANVKLTKAGSAAGVEYETFDEAMAQFSDEIRLNSYLTVQRKKELDLLAVS